MKIKELLKLIILITILSGCSTRPDSSELFSRIEDEYENGNFQKLAQLTDSLNLLFPDETRLSGKADSLALISDRIRLDFSLTEEQFLKKLEGYKLSFNDSLLNVWDKKKWIEWRYIDGEKRYFNRSASNLLLLKKFHEEKEVLSIENSRDPEMIERLGHTAQVLKVWKENPDSLKPVRIKVTYTITVDADVVPDGSVIRCWMPFPKENNPRQENVEILSVSDVDFILSPDSVIHRSVYMEETALKGIGTIFQVSFSFQSSPQYLDLSSAKTLPYDKESSLFRKYTAEQLPQICFTENVKRTADRITSPEDTPSEIVIKIYTWFKENIPWTGALEYSTMENIPEYVLGNRRGDCGMQTFLYMSMLRYKGIPVRWQSGWKLPPDHINLHDWCEIYFEGSGWFPSDISYDLQPTDDKTLKEFFMSGIDSYRMIVNDGVAGSLYPPKEHLRSEPYDFQRGEVEWQGGNLYFDKWDYDMDIEYFEDN